MLTARQRIFLGSTVLVAGLTAGFAWDPAGIRRWIELGEDVERVERENERLRREIEVMRLRVAALRGENGDDRALERAARERGYVREDELLFEFRP